MKARRKLLSGFLALAMLLSLMTGVMVPAWAADSKAQAAEPNMWDSTSIQIIGVEGQEYTIAPKGSDPDWSAAAEPEDGFVIFEDLTPATTYLIYTRLKAETGEAATTEMTTLLTGIGVYSMDDYVPGAVFTVTPDPEDAEGLTYQWFYDEITTDGDNVQHTFLPIEGATATTYTIQAGDVGKYLAVKAYNQYEVEVADITELGPVLEESTPPADEPCPRDDTCPISRFSDAKPDVWYHDGVHWALDTGLMQGVSDDRFAPKGEATRAMVVTMLWRMEGEPQSKPSSFTDVSAGSWYEQAVGWAAETGVVQGVTKTAFAPGEPVTREQLVTILYRYAQFKDMEIVIDTNILDYKDVFDISPWAVEPFQWAVQEGIVQGVEADILSPKSKATRAQIATIFQRYSDVVSEEVPAEEQDDLYLTLVNKTHKLPDNWEDRIELQPIMNAYGEEIRVEKASYEAFLALREDLLKEGVDIDLDSCYRSVERQKELWDEFEKEYGVEYCKQYVAVPGFSEHHTGFALDVCIIKDGKVIYENDEMMKETAIWEKVHEMMPEYGFILRYMEGKEDITGYSYEPWHLRYVGDPAISMEIARRGITLEEYLDQVEPANATVDYGTSSLYTRAEMTAAIDLIRAQIAQWEGVELHSILYAGDGCSSADKVKWLNELEPGKSYTQCIEFLTDFHTTKEGYGAFEPDKEYTDYQWWLARTDGGDWELVSFGY